MKLLHLRLEKFRNHTITQIACSPLGNIFAGNNGEGKTNTLEAIAYLCLTKSFYAANDGVVTQIGETTFTLGGTFESDRGTSFHVTVQYDKNSGKKVLSVDKQPIEHSMEIIGKFPVVVLSPEQSGITMGTPQERRKFVDLAVSQTNRTYLEHLMEYRRIVKQRNRLLVQARESGASEERALAPWNESMAAAGSVIMRKRKEFLVEFSSVVREAYADLAGPEECPEVRYEPTFPMQDNGASAGLEREFLRAIAGRRGIEQKIGFSLVGPHRDEVEFRLNGLPLRQYASQGQHKTFLVALKMAEFRYLQDHCNETPMLLLDDVFSELDPERSAKLLGTAEKTGQTFITMTDPKAAHRALSENERWKTFRVHHGTIDHGEPAETLR